MAERIKVLEVLEATVGGTRRHLVSLVDGLNKERFAVEVAAPFVRNSTIDDKSFVEEIEALQVPLHYVDMCREIRPMSDIKALYTLTNLIRKRQYHIVHLHSSKAGFVGRFAAKLNGVPTVYTPNGFYFLDASSHSKQKIYLSLEQLAGLLTDKLIAVSNSEREVAIKNRIVPKDRVAMIPNAIDPDQFRPQPAIGQQVRLDLGIAPQTAVVGIVARYIPQKDPLNVIRTARLILNELPETVFVWCGEGEMRQAAETLACELGVYDSFRFLGFRTDVKDIMRSFDLLLLSSLFEGLPYVLLEAMSLCLPIVATDVVGSRDVIANGETGMLVPPRNPRQLAQAVLTLLQTPDLRLDMGRRSQRLVHSQYNTAKMVIDVETIYLSLTR